MRLTVRAGMWCAAMAILLSAGASRAADREPGVLRSLVRLTAGASDQFLGALSPDGITLYYVSNRNATTQVFSQKTYGGVAGLLFDDGADVSFPRPSPDGKTLLYISTRDDATGDACVRDLQTGESHCLTGPDSADLQAFWFPGGQSVGVVRRTGLHADLELVRIDIASGRKQSLLQRNLSTPAVSPDGKWLVFVPLERASQDVGVSFSMRLGKGLALARTDGKPVGEVRFDLPGVTGFPAFAHDGRYLYFAQHLSDTNFDGRIDGDDNAVVFRVPFAPDADPPIDPAATEQLTSALWNCQYPAPGRDRLVVTCHADGSLDLYSLPPDGALASGLPADKLLEALEAARDPWQRLLVLGRLARGASGTQKVERLREMTWLHLANGEHASAEYYAAMAGRLAAGDAKVTGWAAVVAELVAHRREERLLNRGQLHDGFVMDQRNRLTRLEKLAQGAPAAVQALSLLAQVEVLDVIGDEGEALRRLAQFDARRVDEPFALRLFGDRGVALLREHGETDKELDALAALATRPSFDDAERLQYADRFVAVLLRGVAKSDQQKRLDAWRGRFDAEGELAFRLELEAQLLQLTPGKDEEVRAAVFALYRQNKSFARRKALVAATLRRAATMSSALLMYEFSNSWVSWLAREHAAREDAVDLFRTVVLERAYLSESQGKIDDARGNFFGVTLQTDDLEAHIGFIELRLREGKDDVAEFYRKRFEKTPDAPVPRFARAWLAARTLTTIPDADVRRQAIAAVEADLAPVGGAFVQQAAWYAFLGYLAHQRLLTGDRSAALPANENYLMALDLARDRPRQAASVLQALGQLQAAVGNHWLALDFFDRRDRLPYLRPASELTARLARARSLYQVGRHSESAADADLALGLLDKYVELKRFRDLVTDRAALLHYAAGHFDKAYALATLAAEGVEPGTNQLANRLRSRLLQAAAAQAAGQADQALQAVTAARKDLAQVTDEALKTSLRPWERPARIDRDDVLLVLLGIEASALEQNGQLAEARVALLARRDLLAGRMDDSEDDESLPLLLAEVEERLADVARKQAQPEVAIRHLEAGLVAVARFTKLTGTVAPPLRLRLLFAYAEATLYGKVPASLLHRDLKADLTAVHRELAARGNPLKAPERFLLATYLTLLDTRKESR
jgi:hypothetical protein